MADDFGRKPFGLHEVLLTDMDGSDQTALPASRVLKFKERVKSAEFTGDDRLQGVHTISEAVEFELEAGGISLEAYARMTGRTMEQAGSTPNRTRTLTGAGAEPYPYFKIYGRVLDDGLGDIHVQLFKCKLTEPMEGSFQYGEFFVNSCKGIAIDDDTNGIFEFVQNETSDDLPSS